MKYILLLLLLLVLPVAYGDVLIEQIMYDAEGADEGKEFVDIKNYGANAINIVNYSLSVGSTSLKIVWQGLGCTSCFVLPNESLRINLDSLHNTAGAIQLNDSNSQIDLVGYGDAIYYLESPAIDVSSGKTLYRNSSTGDNFIDFISSDVINQTQTALSAEITVENVAPVLHEAEVFTQGGAYFVSGNASDLNGITDIISYSYYLGDSLYQNNSQFVGIIPFNGGISELPITNPESELSLAVIDSYGELSDFLLIPIFTSLFDITSIEPVSLAPGDSGFLEITLDAGKDATYTIYLNSLYGKEEIVLDSSEVASLSKGESGTIALPISIPLGVAAGTYKGSLKIVIE